MGIFGLQEIPTAPHARQRLGRKDSWNKDGKRPWLGKSLGSVTGVVGRVSHLVVMISNLFL